MDAPLPAGTMVGEYRVERPIGKGTFGDVYAGEHPVIGKRVAIKVLRQVMSRNKEAVTRFIAEARAVNRARHPNIVDVFAFGTFDGDRHYYVMELLDGMSLGDLLDREGRLTPKRALPILKGIAEALDAAHAADIIHRDLKPDNVFLVPDKAGGFTPKLLDFGVAKLVSEEMGIKTATGVAIGTPRYMSPEQARGRRIDLRTDVYALGVLTHEVLTGAAPFDARGAVEMLLKHTTQPPPSMSSVCPDLSPDLDAPVLAMLAKSPNDRPDSAGAAIAALAAKIEGGEVVNTRPLGTRLPEAETLRQGLQVTEPETVRHGPQPESEPPTESAKLAPLLKTLLLEEAPKAAQPIPKTVLLEKPAAPVQATALSPQNPALAPTMVASSVTAPPLSEPKVPKSNGPIAVVIGMLVIAIAGVAFLALRDKGPAPAATTTTADSPPPPAVAPTTLIKAQETAATATAPSPTVTPSATASAAIDVAPAVSATAARAPSASTSAKPAAAPSQPAPKATSAPSKRDIGF